MATGIAMEDCDYDLDIAVAGQEFKCFVLDFGFMLASAIDPMDIALNNLSSQIRIQRRFGECFAETKIR